MKNLLLILTAVFIVSCSSTSEPPEETAPVPPTATDPMSPEEQGPGVETPEDSLAYGPKACKTNKGIAAYAHIKKKARFNRKGCARANKAWIFDAKQNKWQSTPGKAVTCCDPTASSSLKP